MMNKIWGGLIVISLVVSLFTGRVEQTAAAAISGAGQAIESCISLLGIMCLFTGLSKIGEKAGLMSLFAKVLRPFTRLLFPRLKSDSPAMGAIVMNIVANLLGMGNAATPFGIKAVKELDKLSKSKGIATNEMCMFVVLNTASIQLIPTTLISMRELWGSANSGEIIVPVWIVSILALICGICATKILEKRKI